MKKVLIGLLVFVVLAVVVACAGCTGSSGSNDPIVGTWEWKSTSNEIGDDVFIFNADGSVTEIWYLPGTKDIEDKFVGKWTLNNGVYTVTFDFAGKVDTETFTITSDGKKISMLEYDIDFHKV